MRDDLLQAAQAVVDRKGLAGLTIRDVLGEAGIAPATLYAYFAGKDDLVAAMVRAAAQRVVERVSETAADGQPADVVALWTHCCGPLLAPTSSRTCAVGRPAASRLRWCEASMASW
jgi:AcrR family transcriptional regulator